MVWKYKWSWFDSFSAAQSFPSPSASSLASTVGGYAIAAKDMDGDGDGDGDGDNDVVCVLVDSATSIASIVWYCLFLHYQARYGYIMDIIVFWWTSTTSTSTTTPPNYNNADSSWWLRH